METAFFLKVLNPNRASDDQLNSYFPDMICLEVGELMLILLTHNIVKDLNAVIFIADGVLGSPNDTGWISC